MKMLNVFVAAGLAVTALTSQPVLAATTAPTTQSTQPSATQAQVDAAAAKISELKAKIAVLEASDEIKQWNAIEAEIQTLQNSPRYVALASKRNRDLTSAERREFSALSEQRRGLIQRQAVYQPKKDELSSLQSQLASAEAEYQQLVASLPVPNPDTAAGPEEESFSNDQSFGGNEDGNNSETLENANQVSPNRAQ